MRTRVKFCGMTRREDVLAAAGLGVDAVGLVCVPESPRCLPPAEAAAIRAELPPFVTCVALLRNPTIAETREVIAALRPDLLQFHGDEDAGFCARFGLPYIKAIAMRGAAHETMQLAEYQTAAGILLDGHAPGELGGQGGRFDWRLAENLRIRSLILAGGLHAGNVATAVERVRPYAVDVSSGIEADPRGAPGIKDFGRMKAFVAAVAAADARIARETSNP